MTSRLFGLGHRTAEDEARSRAPVNPPPPPAVQLLGVRVSPVTMDGLHEYILNVCASRSRALVLNVNAHAFNLASTDSGFRKILNDADCVFADGSGVRLAGMFAGVSIPERITYADWTWEFARVSQDAGLRWYFLGGAPGRAEAAAEAVRSRFSSLQIVGAEHGYFDKRAGSDENAAVLSRINAADPDVLFVGFGMPIQEQWYADNWDKLSVRIGLSGGAVFDYISGSLKRPHGLFRATGMEWLGRLIIEPRRLWRRYLVGNPAFLARAAVSGLRSRLRRIADRPS